MELLWNETNAERLVKTLSVQFGVSGELPSPDGRAVREIAGTGAKVKIEDTSVSENELTVSGKIVVTVTALDENGAMFSYESTAGFENVIEAEGACAGMRAEINSCIQSMSLTPDDKGAGMTAAVDMFVMLISDIPLRVIGGVSGLSDLETRIERIRVSKARPLGSSVLRMREELAAENVSKIISAEGQITVRDVSIEQGGASVSGMMTVSAVTASSSGHIEQMIRQIPFHERVDVYGIGNDVYCRAFIEGLYMRSLGEEFALVSLETEVRFEVFCLEEYEAELPTDVFSPSVCFDCLFEKADLISSLGTVTAQSTVRETVSLKDNSADLKQALFAHAAPIITETCVRSGAVDVSGVLVTSVTYESMAGKIYTFSEDVPFSTSFDIAPEADLPVIRASCIACASAGSERNVQIQYNLVLEADEYKTSGYNAVTGLAESKRNETSGGLVICFASEGEDVFDIAKRCGVSCAEVRALNPDIAEPFRDGDKLLILA